MIALHLLAPTRIVWQESTLTIGRTHSHHCFMFLCFKGGGACVGGSRCMKNYENEYQRFTSTDWPKEITGRSILSQNPDESPFHNYTHWFIPYCSQDLYLGFGGHINISSSSSSISLVSNGGAIFEKALEVWLQAVSNLGVENVVIAGVSASAIGLINNFKAVIATSQAAKSSHLTIVLDSGLLSPVQPDDNVEDLINQTVSSDLHPLCFEPYTEGLLTSPCCLSLVCMISRDKFISSWLTEETIGDDVTESLLVMNSAYDPYELRAVASTHQESMWAVAGTAWSIGEFGGRRKHAVRTLSQLASFSNESMIHHDVLFMTGSCVLHVFLYLSDEFEKRECGSEDGGGRYVCQGNEPAVGYQFPIRGSLNAVLWKFPGTWETAEVDGHAVRNVLTDFALQRHHQVPFTTRYGSWKYLTDSCHGPNCLKGGHDISVCHKEFMEIDSQFLEIPFVFATVTLLYLGLIMASGCIIKLISKSALRDMKTVSKSSRPSFIRRALVFPLPEQYRSKFDQPIMVSNLNVSVSLSGKVLLKDISFAAAPGSMVCLLGRSGCGEFITLSLLFLFSVQF